MKAVAWQIRLPQSYRGWEECTKERYDDTIRTGRYCGLPTGTKDVEVRERFTAAVQPSQQGEAEDLSRFPDEFRGDDAHLVRCIEALLSLDAKNALVPHGIGGHARGLLSAAMHRLASRPLPIPAEPLGRDAEGLALIVEALEQSQPLANAYPEARERHARALAAARRLRPTVDEAGIERMALQMMFDRFPDRPRDDLRESFKRAPTREHWLRRARAALTAALTEADSHGK